MMDAAAPANFDVKNGHSLQDRRDPDRRHGIGDLFHGRFHNAAGNAALEEAFSRARSEPNCPSSKSTIVLARFAPSKADPHAAVKGRCHLHWLSHKECSYASFKACAMSAIRSDGCSIPIDSRIVESKTPFFWRMSARTPEWVMLAGRLASDSVPPRLTASLKICSAFKNLNAAAWPPTMSNEKVEPAPVHCLANRRPAGEASSW